MILTRDEAHLTLIAVAWGTIAIQRELGIIGDDYTIDTDKEQDPENQKILSVFLQVRSMLEKRMGLKPEEIETDRFELLDFDND